MQPQKATAPFRRLVVPRKLPRPHKEQTAAKLNRILHLLEENATTRLQRIPDAAPKTQRTAKPAGS